MSICLYRHYCRHIKYFYIYCSIYFRIVAYCEKSFYLQIISRLNILTRSFFRILITDKARTVLKNLSSYADHELSIVNKIKAPELTYIVIFTMIPWSIFINNLFFYTNILHIENGDKHGVPARLSKDYFYNIHWQVFYIIFHNYQISFNRSWKFVAVNWN